MEIKLTQFSLVSKALLIYPKHPSFSQEGDKDCLEINPEVFIDYNISGIGFKIIQIKTNYEEIDTSRLAEWTL